jgi:hypothetical protein
VDISHLKNESVKLVGNDMPLSEEEKRRIIDLHFNQGKTIREVSDFDRLVYFCKECQLSLVMK